MQLEVAASSREKKSQESPQAFLALKIKNIFR